MKKTIDLGHDHIAYFTAWMPDREINPQYDGIPDVELFGLNIEHPKKSDPSQRCVGGVTFDGEVQRLIHPKVAKWTLVSDEPLHIEPSVLCSCGDHGWIRDGRWVPA